jgi:hypothetical protein
VAVLRSKASLRPSSVYIIILIPAVVTRSPYVCVNYTMPPGTPYNAFILPYNIRVDDFADSGNLEYAPALHLLTHTHTDHINGLSAKSFGYTVICSHDAKEMLLRHEVYAERALHEQELRSEKLRTFSHLKVHPFVTPDGGMYYNGSRDLLVSRICSFHVIHKFKYRSATTSAGNTDCGRAR